MIFLDLPTINGSGTTEQQLSEIRSYIYKNNEQINSALSNLTIDKIWEQTASAVSSANQSEDETPKILKQYQRIRDLIIKTADVVAQSDEKMEMAFNGSYLAKSQFGEYLRNTSVEVDGNSTGFTELYRYSSRIGTDYTNYKSDFENYIKRGLLDNTGATPIYGIEVGLLNSSINVDGQSIPTGEKYRTRITPNKWSFLRGSSEVASITEDEITFPKANITGGSIDIGVDHKFYVDSEGNLTAKSGRFYGDLSAEKIKTSWNGQSGNHVQLNADELEILDSRNNKSFYMDSGGLTFYRKDNMDQEMGFIRKRMFTYEGLTYNSIWGTEIQLRNNFNSYFAIKSYDLDNDGVLINPRYDFVIVPKQGVASTYPPSPYNAAGIYLNKPLYIIETLGNNVIKHQGATTTINLNTASSITVVNGIITNVS